MKKIILIALAMILLCIACDEVTSSDYTATTQLNEDYNISPNGDLHVSYKDITSILEINALTDSQILRDEKERLLILTDPTDRYSHGILGDDLEASSVTIVDLSDTPISINKFLIDKEWVIESIKPIWTDWDDDGSREILLTLSNNTYGAKLVLYDEKGSVLAESDPIGTGYRWRHALDIVSLGEDEKFLVDVITPHIGGIIGIYSWDKDASFIKSEYQLRGYSTHDIGSRLMGMFAFTIDDLSGKKLLIIPNQAKTEVLAFSYSNGQLNEEWRLDLGGKLNSNISIIEKDNVKCLNVIVGNNQEVFLNISE